MRISPGGGTGHLSYCTNIHPGESWDQTFQNIKTHTIGIRDHVAPQKPFGIGLRLSDLASRELIEGDCLAEFQRFLEANDLYVFTINGFPFGQFHGTRIKENVFAPDWTAPERLTYTNRLGDILARLLPEGEIGSISTLPASFSEWIHSDEQVRRIVANLAECAFHLSKIEHRTGRYLHLGLEPEPMGMFETIDGTIDFFASKLWDHGGHYLEEEHGFSADTGGEILRRHIGMCYDTCHMAVEYEEAKSAAERLRQSGILLSKVQISSALRLVPSESALKELARYADSTYLHQVIAMRPDGQLSRWKDIAPAMDARGELLESRELRVHCHVPLFMRENRGISSTADHVSDLFALPEISQMVSHFEIETYTWDVLPEELRTENIDEAVAREFEWFLKQIE